MPQSGRSFVTRYDTFKDSVSELGKSIGYLFTAKLFQLTLTMPSMNPVSKSMYLGKLLNIESEGDKESEPDMAEFTKARQMIKESTSEEQIVKTLQNVSPIVQHQIAGEVVETLVSRRMIEKRTKHVLQKYSSLLEPNPRAIKRLVNAYSTARWVLTFESNPVDIEPLTLWIILKMRWPDLADYLRSSPEAIKYVGRRGKLPERIPENIREILSSPDLSTLVTFRHGGPLTKDKILDCCGLSRKKNETPEQVAP